MQKILLALSNVFLFLHATAQSPRYVYQSEPDEALSVRNIHPWNSKNVVDYSGIYHFGDSEWEWDLVVSANDSMIVFQSFSNKWGKTDIDEKETWLKNSRVFKNAKITGNRFVTDSLNGYFMVYKEDTAVSYGIILTERADKLDTVEFGGRINITTDNFFDGDYPQLSQKVLDDSFFANKTKEQLQIMRNEVYARYGMRFIKGGKMYNWFIQKNWYQPWRDLTNSCLTETEIRNIAKVLRFEKM